ncbi:MAG: lipid-A-disaccharide synthase [Thermoanaerobaculales bacterium]|jgi:lipid-A-disaccharide synthase|nr:lipid-A-disaccharide synthase [Thermoanaerobaculales bacterium]
MSRLLVVAGEVSGDLHAGNLLSELRRLDPGIEACGIGGERLQAAGLECLASTDELAHMGLVEVLRELPRIRRVMKRVVDEARRRRPDLAVLVDSPDFNLRLAARLDRIGVPTVLYVSPQLWAWRRGRVKVVRRLAKEVICLLPFEVPFYLDHGVPARYVGHPLVDDLARDGLLDERFAASPGKLALLPGSRAMEVRQLLPTMLAAAAELTDRLTDIVLVEAPGVGRVIDEIIGNAGTAAAVRRVGGGERRRELATSRLAWTASGTATLECALLDVPMIVGYRLQPLSYALARLLVRVPHVALVNLIAGERAAPELIQGRWNPKELIATTLELLGGRAGGQRAALAPVRERLGPPGASRRAAEAVLEHL